MPADLAQLLYEAAPAPSSPVDPDRLWSTGRRRRRHRRIVVGVSIVATLALIGLAGEPDHDVTTAADPTTDFTVEYPATWHQAETTLTPNLVDPVQIVTLGTGDLPAGGHSCAQFPVAALEAMRPTDALITVQERLSFNAAGFPERPDQFPPEGSRNISEVVDCVAQPPQFDHWFFWFHDAGRAFYVLVAIGPQATDQTRAEAWAILDSLHFETRS